MRAAKESSKTRNTPASFCFICSWQSTTANHAGSALTPTCSSGPRILQAHVARHLAANLETMLPHQECPCACLHVCTSPLVCACTHACVWVLLGESCEVKLHGSEKPAMNSTKQQAQTCPRLQSKSADFLATNTTLLNNAQHHRPSVTLHPIIL